MIKSSLEPKLNDDGVLSIARVVEMFGDRGDIIADLKAIAFTLANKSKKAGTKEQQTAERIVFEQAFAEGFRMTLEEAKEMDEQACEEMQEEIVRGLSEEFGDGVKVLKA